MFVSVDDRVVAVVASIASEQHAGNLPEVRLESRLVQDVGLDSLRLLELTVSLEVEFGLEPLGDSEFSGVSTVADVAELVASKIS